MPEDGLGFLWSTGNARIDRMLCGAIGIFEAAFPDRIRGYYLFGSQMDGSAVAVSDIDLFVVFKGDFADQHEEDRARRLWHACSQLSAVQCDLVPFAERRLFADGHFRLKSASLLVYGDDMRERMPPISLDAYLRTYTEASFAYMAQIIRRMDTLVYPLTFPDATSAFYGYDDQDPHIGRDGARSIKGMVSAVCWAATIIVAFHAGRMIGTKAESVQAYRELIGDRWTPFIETLYTKGKGAWGYLVPGDDADRMLLRELCRETLAFENHYLACYRAYLLMQLRQGDEASVRFAVERLSTVYYPDAEVSDTLRAVALSGHPALRTSAQETLRRIEGARERRISR